MALFLRLLDTMPLSRDELVAQARIDIPPLLRDRIWAALLNVDGDTEQQYAAYDKTSESPYDRQVRVTLCGHAPRPVELERLTRQADPALAGRLVAPRSTWTSRGAISTTRSWRRRRGTASCGRCSRPGWRPTTSSCTGKVRGNGRIK